MWRNWNLCAFLIGILIAVAVENSLAVPQSLNAELSYDPAIPLLGIPPKEPNSNTYSYTYVHCSTIHNCQKVEMFQMSVS